MRMKAFILGSLALLTPSLAAAADLLTDDGEVIVGPMSTSTSTAPTHSPSPSCAPAPFSGMGSYNRANLAQMIEDPEDLCTGRPMGPADAEAVIHRHEKLLNASSAQPASASSIAGTPQ